VLGVLAGFAVLVKFNVGVTALAVAGLTSVLAARPLRSTALAAGGALVGGLGGWLLAGQPLGTAVDWVRQSLDVASAYSSAMGHRPDDMPSLPAQWAALGALAMVGVLVIGFLATRGLGRRVRLATGAVLLVTMASAYLASSTRLDAGHAQFLLVTAFVVGAPLAAAVSWPRLPWLPWVLVVGVAAAELAVGTAVAGRGWHSTVVHPVRSVQDLRRAGELAVSAPDREALLAGQKAVLTTAYQALIPEFELEAQDPSVPAVTGPSPAVVQALSGARVHAEQWAVGLVWA
jgi:hypothetical protein